MLLISALLVIFFLFLSIGSAAAFPVFELNALARVFFNLSGFLINVCEAINLPLM